jgi:tRNA(Ile)-lysidine synthase
VIRCWLTASGAGELSAAHTDAVARLVTDWHGQRRVDVPGLRVGRADGVLVADSPPRRARYR